MNQLMEIDEIEDYMKGRFLTFLIGNETFGVPISHVMEIIGIQPITKIPETPDYIKGIVNLRGKIVPVLDVKLRFKKVETEYNDRTCIIVIEFNNMSIGLIVDSVSEVLSIRDEDVSEKPELGGKIGGNYVKNIGKSHDNVILLIDCEKLLSTEELDTVSDCL